MLIEKAFGKDSVELKRPIRMWIPDIEMIVAAENADVGSSHLAAHFATASIASVENSAEAVKLSARSS